VAGISWTLEQLRELTTARLQKVPELASQPVHIDALINAAVMHLTLVLPDELRGSLYTTYQENYVQNKKEYTEPADMLEFRHIFINGVKCVERYENDQPSLVSNQYLGAPLEYPVFIRFGKYFHLFPSNQTTITNGVVWHFVKIPDEMTTDNAMPDLPGMVHPLIPEAAVEVLWEMLFNDSYGGLNRALSRLSQRVESSRRQSQRRGRPPGPIERPAEPGEPIGGPVD